MVKTLQEAYRWLKQFNTSGSYESGYLVLHCLLYSTNFIRSFNACISITVYLSLRKRLIILSIFPMYVITKTFATGRPSPTKQLFIHSHRPTAFCHWYNYVQLHEHKNNISIYLCQTPVFIEWYETV